MMKRILHRIFRDIYIGLLYGRNLLALRPLEIDAIHIRFEEIQERRRSAIYWVARGCHRIRIGKYGSFPGVIKGVSVQSPDSACVIHVVFSGLFKCEHRYVLVHAGHDQVKRQFRAFANTPVLITGRFDVNWLENTFQDNNCRLETGFHPEVLDCEISHQQIRYKQIETFSEFLKTFTDQQTNFQ